MTSNKHEAYLVAVRTINHVTTFSEEIALDDADARVVAAGPVDRGSSPVLARGADGESLRLFLVNLDVLPRAPVVSVQFVAKLIPVWVVEPVKEEPLLLFFLVVEIVERL